MGESSYSNLNAFFSPPTFNAPGDPYVERVDEHAAPRPRRRKRSIFVSEDAAAADGLSPGCRFRPKGALRNMRQFQTTGPKKGQTGNAIGYGPLDYKAAYTQPFEDMHKLDATQRTVGKARFTTPSGFNYSSPSKRSTGRGDHFGTFRGQVPYFSSGGAEGYKRSSYGVAYRNIHTSPGKRGSYGVSGTLIGGENPKYRPSYYSAREEDEKLEHKLHRMAVGDRRAFTAASRTRGCFDKNKIYSNEGMEFAAKPRPRVNMDEGHIFRPTNPPKIGYNSTLTPFPPAMSDPYDEKERMNAQMPDRRVPRTNRNKGLSPSLQQRKPFRPTSGARTTVTRPISIMRVRLR